MLATALSYTAPRSPIPFARPLPGGTRQSPLDGRFERAQLCRVEAREHLFTEGDSKTHVYRVETGAISLYRVLPDGRRQVVDFALPGDLIGLGSPGVHRLNAQATKPTRLRSLPLGALSQLAESDPELALKLYEAVSQELEAAHTLLMTVGKRSAVERVATFLLLLSRRNTRNGNDSHIIELPMSRTDIADMLGLTIETVSRTFTKLRGEGVIDLEQSARVLIRDHDELARLAEGDEAA